MATIEEMMKHGLKTKALLCVLALAIVPQLLSAQWKLSVNAGALYNMYSIDKQFMTDYRYEGAWGYTTDIVAQYNFTDWFGLRAGLTACQRNYRHTRYQMANDLNMLYRNDYLMLPVTAQFSFGGKAVRGLVGLGVYGGFWLNSHRSGMDYTSISDAHFDFSEKVPFNKEKDQRWDFGYTATLGIEWQVAAHWAIQAEAVGYYSVVSSVKQYMAHVKDYRYNTSLGLRAGVIYLF